MYKTTIKADWSVLRWMFPGIRVLTFEDPMAVVRKLFPSPCPFRTPGAGQSDVNAACSMLKVIPSGNALENLPSDTPCSDVMVNRLIANYESCGFFHDDEYYQTAAQGLRLNFKNNPSQAEVYGTFRVTSPKLLKRLSNKHPGAEIEITVERLTNAGDGQLVAHLTKQGGSMEWTHLSYSSQEPEPDPETKPQIKEITGYQTSDGQFFRSRRQAEDHELQLERDRETARILGEHLGVTKALVSAALQGLRRTEHPKAHEILTLLHRYAS